MSGLGEFAAVRHGMIGRYADPNLTVPDRSPSAVPSKRYRGRKRAEKRGPLPPGTKRPAALIPWLEALTVTQGEGAGSALRLFPWERDWIAGLEATRRRTVGLSDRTGSR